MMTSFSKILFSIFLATGLACVVCPAMDIVKDGKPVAVIVLPAETEYDSVMKTQPADVQARAKQLGDDEQLAADELQSFIEKITGAKLEIKREAKIPEGPAILIGVTFAREAGLARQIDQLAKDGIILEARKDKLYLTGRRARGTLFAAYDFLESIGCRWVMPGSFGEIYPENKNISTTISKTENPSHSERYWWCTYGNAPDYPRWTLRNKGTFVKALGDPQIAQGHGLAGPLAWGKTQPKYAVKKMVGDKEELVLPDEYYAIVDGKPSGQSPNFSNPKVWDMYADYFIEHFKNTGAKYASISAEDGFVIDERPESNVLGEEYDWIAGNKSATDKLWTFHNQVLNRVGKVYPDRKFGVLVYSNNMMPPKKSKVHPQMALVFAPLTICPLHHVRDARCKSNRAYVQWLPEWLRQANEVGAESYYYDYEPLGYSWNVAMICPRWGIIGTNYPWFKSMGLTGHTTQGYDDWASCGLDNYVMQKLYWNVNLNYKDIVADYATARFEAAAPLMIEYYSIYEKALADVSDIYANEVWGNHLVLTPQVRTAARAVLERAVKVKNSARAKAQLDTMVLLQQSTDAACDAEEEARTTGDYGKAVQILEQVFQVADKLNAIYPKFMNPNRVNKTDKTQYLTCGIYNQYVDFDKKIKASAASMVLPRFWKGMIDTNNAAVAAGYHKPENPVHMLDDLDSTVMPDVKYGTERDPGAFFYRADVAVPDTFAGKQASIFFASLIAEGLEMWINGKPVEFTQNDKKSTIWIGPKYFWINYDHSIEFDVTPYIAPGKVNTIAFRATKTHDFCGTYRRIFLLAK